MKREYIADVVKIQQTLIATLDDQTFVLVSLPDGVTLDAAWADVDDVGQMEVDGQDAVCRTTSGDVRFRLTLPPERIDPGAKWLQATVLGHGPGAIITLDLGHGEEMCPLAGDGRTPIDELLAHIETSLPIGCEVRVMRGEFEAIAAITHPDPTIERMAVAMLEWRGVDLAAIRRHIMENGRVYGRVQINVKHDRNGGVSTTEDYDDGAGGTIEVEMWQGHVMLGLNVDGVCYAHDCLILQDRTLPETAAAAVIGRPLSNLVGLPFEHADPVVTGIDGSIGDTFVSWDADRVRLSEMA